MTPASLIQRSRGERGAALIIALIVMSIVCTLTAVGVAAAVHDNSGTRRDANKKNALEAAEAGLQIALYRLNMLRPDDTHCVGDAVATADTTGTCPSSTTTLGNGSTYRYYTTAVLGSGDTCVGLTVTSDSNIAQRCVTAVGITNGVAARSQIRVAAFGAEPLFPVAGITGLKYVTLNGNPYVNGYAASNGTITVNGNVYLGGAMVGPRGQLIKNGNVTVGPFVRLTSPIVLGPVDPGTSNQSSLTACPERQAAGFPACNDNYRIVNGLQSPPLVPYDQSDSIDYNPATRTLTLIGNKASLTLGGGLYNFCEVTIAGNASVTIAATTKTEIFIDSPDNPNSGCPPGTGHFTASGRVTWNNSSGDPTAFQLYVYGNNDGSNAVTLNGNADYFNGLVYAPQSTVVLNGNITYYGAISGNIVVLNGRGYAWDERAGHLKARSTGLFYRTAWAQCTSVVPTGSPGSGCG